MPFQEDLQAVVSPAHQPQLLLRSPSLAVLQREPPGVPHAQPVPGSRDALPQPRSRPAPRYPNPLRGGLFAAGTAGVPRVPPSLAVTRFSLCGRCCVPAEHLSLLQHPNVTRRPRAPQLPARAGPQTGRATLQSGTSQIHQQHPPLAPRLHPFLRPAPAFSPALPVPAPGVPQNPSFLPRQDPVPPHHRPAELATPQRRLPPLPPPQTRPVGREDRHRPGREENRRWPQAGAGDVSDGWGDHRGGRSAGVPR